MALNGLFLPQIRKGELEFIRKGGIFQVVQLWVNLPAKYKMTPAKYQTIENKDMTKVLLDDGKSSIEIVAGEFKGKKGPASVFSPVDMFLSLIHISEPTRPY